MPKNLLAVLLLLGLLSGCTKPSPTPSDRYQSSLKAEIKMQGNAIIYNDNLYEPTGGYRRVTNDDTTLLVQLNQAGKYQFYIERDELEFPTRIYVYISGSEFYDVYKLKPDY